MKASPCNIVKLMYETEDRTYKIFFPLLKEGKLTGLKFYNPSELRGINSYQTLIYDGPSLYLKVNLNHDKIDILRTVDDIVSNGQKLLGIHTGKGTRKGATKREQEKLIQSKFYEYFFDKGYSVTEAYKEIADELNKEPDTIKKLYIEPLRLELIKNISILHRGKKVKTWDDIKRHAGLELTKKKYRKRGDNE
jgi:hypothetical protein